MNTPISKFVKDGIEWNPYSIQFESPDGCFMFAIWAISQEHATLQLDSIRENAAVVGKIVYTEDV
jgi:hypothetical protein